MQESNMNFDIKSHLIQRHVDLDLHKPSLSETNATFLLYSLTGKLVGYQRYMPLNAKLCSNNLNGRYYSYRSNDEIAIFGLESYKANSTVFITEGVFDAVRLTKRGCCALALLTNAPNSSMLNFLSLLPNKIVAVVDNDEGGKFFKKKIRHVSNAIITCTHCKDLGESSEDFVDFIINYLN
jgi:hypothetical protein